MTDDLIDYEVMTEEDALGLLPKGDYKATITDAIKRMSQSGITYVVLNVVINENYRNNKFSVWCTLPFILKHAAESTGNGDKWLNKELKLSDFTNKKCMCRVKIRQPNDKNPLPKNEIWDFLPYKEEKLDLNDDLSF